MSKPVVFGDPNTPTDNCSNCGHVLEFEREFATLCDRCGEDYNRECADPPEDEPDDDGL